MATEVGSNKNEPLLAASITDDIVGGEPESITYYFADKMAELICLFDKKQKDYGRENIAEFGRFGVLVRMNDKMARIKNLTLEGSLLAKMDSKEIGLIGTIRNESLRDSYMDIAVYAVIDWLLEDGTW